MTDVPYVRDLRFEYEALETVAPNVRRIMARNPGPFTFYGSGTYVLGRGKVALIDPGPPLEEHSHAILQALRGETITHILITHTHMDHCGAAPAIKAATGAPTFGFGAHGGMTGAAAAGGAAEEGADRAFTPDNVLRNGDTVAGNGWRVTAVHTPGHTSNHLCYALADDRILFTGDHVMGWSTTVIAPPDGNMGDYMRSLALLLDRDDVAYFPTHGPPVRDTKTYVRALIAHRREREAAILRVLTAGPKTIPEIVDAVYDNLAPGLHFAAGLSVLAHLNELMQSGRVRSDGTPAADTRYAIAIEGSRA